MGGFRPFNSLHDETIEAQGAIMANRFVTYSGVQASVLGEQVMGVSRYAEEYGRPLAITVIGIPSVEAGGPIIAGEKLTTDALGRAIPHPGGTEAVSGIAISSVSGAGAFVRIKLA